MLYQNLFTTLYDLLHEGEIEPQLYPQILRPYGTRVLELGSGTGRIALPLASAGFSVTGIEIDPAMTACALEKAKGHPHFTAVSGDVRCFRLDQLFDCVILPCNLLFYFHDAADALAVLKNAAQHTRPGGLVLIDCSLPDLPTMLADNDQTLICEFALPDGSLLRDHFTPHFNFRSQMETDDVTVDLWRDGSLQHTASWTESLTWYMPREVRSLITAAGLEIVRESGRLSDLSGNTPIGTGSEMVFFCTPHTI